MMKFAILLFFTSVSGSQVRADPVRIENSWTCADWATSRRGSYALPVEQFLVGILNGFVLTSGKDFWRSPVPINTSQAFYWMDRYCENNPLDNVVFGALKLGNERLGEGWSAN